MSKPSEDAKGHQPAAGDVAKDASDSIRYVNLYESEDKIYTRYINGFYNKIRKYTGIPLLLGYLLVPWFTIDNRPAMLFDLGERKFHIFWMTFWPQDGMYLAWLLIISAFALFTVTMIAGRVWCGYTCPQTVWTMMFMWVERHAEGDRNKRIKLDQAPWGVNKIWRKTLKHTGWILIGFITGLTWVGYFTPIKALTFELLTFEANLIAVFWVLFFTGMTYLNAGWLREQVCKYMCPYARFQAVMYDQDTLAVQYDEARGESRGPRKATDDYKAQGLGDCIDCSWCVQVCPVDIDIRDGLQYECINCGLCVDACNSVMDKVGYERGLISYTSEDILLTGKNHWWKRWRLWGYLALTLIMVSVFIFNIADRMPLTVDVARDRGNSMFRIRGPNVQNVYTIKINNMDDKAHRFNVEVEGDLAYSVDGYKALPIDAGELFTVPIRVLAPRKDITQSKNTIYIRVTAKDNPELTDEHKAVFVGPDRK